MDLSIFQQTFCTCHVIRTVLTAFKYFGKYYYKHYERNDVNSFHILLANSETHSVSYKFVSAWDQHHTVNVLKTSSFALLPLVCCHHTVSTSSSSFKSSLSLKQSVSHLSKMPLHRPFFRFCIFCFPLLQNPYLTATMLFFVMSCSLPNALAALLPDCKTYHILRVAELFFIYWVLGRTSHSTIIHLLEGFPTSWQFQKLLRLQWLLAFFNRIIA